MSGQVPLEQGLKILVPSYYAEHYRNQMDKLCPQAKVIPFKLRERRSVFSQQRTYDLVLDDPHSKSNDDTEGAAVCVAPIELTSEASAYLVHHFPALRWIHSTRTGVDYLLNNEVRRRKILITSSHVCSEAMAEYVLAMILAAAKSFPAHMRLQSTAEWKFLGSRMLKGRRAGVLGLGRIGQAIVKRLKANQLEVWGWNRSKVSLKELEQYLPADRENLKKLCRECDFVIVALPLTEKTRHLVDVEILESMKADAWLMNVARGEIVDQEALYWRLKNKQIGGACLDVMEDESKPALEKFGHLENVLITHHSSFYFPEYNQVVCEDFLAKLKCYLAGEPLPDTVSLERGY